MQKIKSLNDLIITFKGEKKLALVINGKEISYDDLYKNILIFASQIIKKSKGKKINIGIYTNDPYENISIYFACIYSDTIPVPISNLNFLKKKNSLHDDYKIKFIIIGKKNKNEIIFEKIQILKLDSCFNSFKNKKNNLNKKKTNIHDTASIILTSGTTGLKKGVMLSHNNLIKTSKYINNFMCIKKNIIEYLMVPLISSFGFARLRCVMLKKGCLIIDSGFFNPLLMIKWFEKYNINCISGVPSSFAMLISIPLKLLKNVRKKIIWAEIGSAPMKKAHKAKLLNLFPNKKIVMHYGLTEASRSTLLHLKTDNKKNELIGKPSPGVKISICDNSRKIIKKKNIVGEIVIKGQNVAKGYCNYLSKNFENRKFYTGDLGSIDKNGYIYFHGRKDEIINIGGIKISPIFLEDIINKKIPLGFDFAIFSSTKKHKIHTETVGIFIKKRINLKNKLNKINELLFNNGVPKEGKIRDVIYIRKFPLTSNGKIKRKFLKNYVTNINKNI
jgi:long-chain acyl-CoA synthetase